MSQLTKREQIAAMALQGLLAGLRWDFVRPDNYWEAQGPSNRELVRDALELADLMLALESGEDK